MEQQIILRLRAQNKELERELFAYLRKCEDLEENKERSMARMQAKLRKARNEIEALQKRMTALAKEVSSD